MLNKQIQQANFVFLNLRQRGNNLIRDEIRAARLGRQCDLLLKPGHGAVGI